MKNEISPRAHQTDLENQFPNVCICFSFSQEVNLRCHLTFENIRLGRMFFLSPFNRYLTGSMAKVRGNGPCKYSLSSSKEQDSSSPNLFWFVCLSFSLGSPYLKNTEG